jgi:hypothetical protein
MLLSNFAKNFDLGLLSEDQDTAAGAKHAYVDIYDR